MLNEEVTTVEIDRAKKALRSSALKFDLEFPDYPGKEFDLTGRMNLRLKEYDLELPKTLKRARGRRR